MDSTWGSGWANGHPIWNEVEVGFMMAMQHPRLVKFIGAGEMHDKTESQWSLQDGEEGEQNFVLFTVQELMTGGSLDKRLWNMPLESVSWLERITWARDTAEGMDYIHSKGFAHRDLKSMNVLYDIDSGRAKVADFGMARSTPKTNHGREEAQSYRGYLSMRLMAVPDEVSGLHMMTAMCGTPPWMAPELAANELEIQQKYNATRQHRAASRAEALKSAASFEKCRSNIQYSMNVDVYSFGVLMYELVSHRTPWDGVELSKIYECVVAGDRPQTPAAAWVGAPKWWKPMMEQCWADAPSERPCFKTIHNILAIQHQDHKCPMGASQARPMSSKECRTEMTRTRTMSAPTRPKNGEEWEEGGRDQQDAQQSEDPESKREAGWFKRNTVDPSNLRGSARTSDPETRAQSTLVINV